MFSESHLLTQEHIKAKDQQSIIKLIPQYIINSLSDNFNFLSLSNWTHGAIDIGIWLWSALNWNHSEVEDWKVLWSEIIWRLQIEKCFGVKSSGGCWFNPDYE